MQLLVGIFLQPSRTFDELIKHKHLLLGVVIWLLNIAIYAFSTTYVFSKTINNTNIGWQPYYDFILHPKLLIKASGVFIVVYVQYIIATKYYKFKNNFLALLSCNFFMLIADSFHKLFIALFAATGLMSALNYLNVPFFIWWSWLAILALAKVYDTTLKKGAVIYFGTIILAGTVMFLAYFLLVSGMQS